MSLFQVFTDDDICHLLEANGYGKHKIKNEYLIYQLSFLPLSLSEHNQMMVHDFINKHGDVYKEFVIPAAYTKHNKARVIELPDRFCDAVEIYLDWYVSNEDIPSDYRQKSHTFRGLSDEAPMLLNNESNIYARTKNKTATGAEYQPNNLRSKVKSLLNKAGFDWATFKTFTDSLIVNLHRNNADINQIDEMFEFRSRETVLNRINGNVLTLSDALNEVYSRIKVTGH